MHGDKTIKKYNYGNIQKKLQKKPSLDYNEVIILTIFQFLAFCDLLKCIVIALIVNV